MARCLEIEAAPAAFDHASAHQHFPQNLCFGRFAVHCASVSAFEGDSDLFLKRPLTKGPLRVQHPGQGYLDARIVLRRYRNERETFIVSASFDIKVRYTIEPESSLKGAGRSMPIAKHSLEVTDLRTGERLAEMVYVIDRARILAFREITRGQANINVFVLQAMNLVQSAVQHPKSWVAPKIRYEP
jgi:hypothetical protein